MVSENDEGKRDKNNILKEFIMQVKRFLMIFGIFAFLFAGVLGTVFSYIGFTLQISVFIAMMLGVLIALFYYIYKQRF